MHSAAVLGGSTILSMVGWIIGVLIGSGFSYGKAQFFGSRRTVQEGAFTCFIRSGTGSDFGTSTVVRCVVSRRSPKSPLTPVHGVLSFGEEIKGGAVARVPLSRTSPPLSSVSVHTPCSSSIDTTCGLTVRSSRTSTLPLTFCPRVEMRFASLKLNASKFSPGSPAFPESYFSVTR